MICNKQYWCDADGCNECVIVPNAEAKNPEQSMTRSGWQVFASLDESRDDVKHVHRCFCPSHHKPPKRKIVIECGEHGMTVPEFDEFVPYTGDWAHAPAESDLPIMANGKRPLPVIMQDINTLCRVIEKRIPGYMNAPKKEDDEPELYLHMPVSMVKAVAKTPEFRNYIRDAPDGLQALCSRHNPNRKYSMSPQLYGLWVVAIEESSVPVHAGK